ncbi:hypothetical protein SDC9_72842 [bioreactor metagenome]|uniref:Uncharacterized protein n=1 Tax=bioreactor metagenome TaxID=1076179 RepID=A0A644YEN3_9ZZZZ
MKFETIIRRNRMTAEKPEFRQMMSSFLDKVMELEFTIKSNDGVYSIYLDGIKVYSLERDTCKYNRHYYASTITSDKLEQLEIVLYNFFGKGGQGSSLIGKAVD